MYKYFVILSLRKKINIYLKISIYLSSTEHGSESSASGKLCLGLETVNNIESITREVVLVIIFYRNSSAVLAKKSMEHNF